MPYTGEEIVRDNIKNLTLSSDETPGASADRESWRRPIHCNKCSGEHYRNDVCPNWRCGICYQTNHSNYCPYLYLIPQGASYDRETCYIVCESYHDFDEEKWACMQCGGRRAKLREKFCVVCYRPGHNGYECPVDKVLAAKLKRVRDERRAVMTQQFLGGTLNCSPESPPAESKNAASPLVQTEVDT